ncbi:Tyrosinase family protein asqI [Paramyrothecium foliicola]|nr:Tyrosinase family protein asqI [Paramyrothecium foliicola]
MFNPDSLEYSRRNSSADEAISSRIGQVSGGLVMNSNISWAGYPDMSEYRNTFHTRADSVGYTSRLRSNDPAHYPWGPEIAGQSREATPRSSWANVVPCADATIKGQVRGNPSGYPGVSYHDQDWGVQSFAEAIISWTWGHARMGPYTVVWLDALTKDGASHTTGYVAHNGHVVSADCGSIKVRPAVPRSTYPPILTSGVPEAFTLEAPLQNGHMLEAYVRPKLVTIGGTVYMRWTGHVKGTVAKTRFKGVASLEKSNYF